MKELTNCPFCSCEAILHQEISAWVMCSGCKVVTPYYDSEQEAIDAWNKRAQSSTTIVILGYPKGHTHTFEMRELLERVIRGLKNQRRRTSRRELVAEAFGVGSTVAHGLCLEFGFDPHEVI